MQKQHILNMKTFSTTLHKRIDLVVLLHPTRQKIGHSGDVPQDNLLAWYGKTKPNTTKAHIQQSNEMYNNTKYTQLAATLQ